MQNEPMRVGLVGAGAIAQSYAQALRDSSAVRLVGVADVRIEAARAMAEDMGCSSFDSHEALAKDTDCQAVIVCTPPSTHPEVCLHFLQRGTPVLCEKPLSVDSASARTMLAAAQDADVVFTMASKFRYVEDVIRAKSLVTSGMLGDLILVDNSFTGHVDMSRRWNSDPQISGGGVLIDNGTHSVDLMRYFLGPLASVQAVEGNRMQGLPVEDTIRLSVRSRSDVLGSIDLSWSISKDLDSFIDLYGSNGTARVGWRESKYRLSHSKDWVVFGSGYDKIAAFRRQIENFCAAIRGQEALLIDADDALASVEVIEAAYDSLSRNDWVSVGSGKSTR